MGHTSAGAIVDYELANRQKIAIFVFVNYKRQKGKGKSRLMSPSRIYLQVRMKLKEPLKLISWVYLSTVGFSSTIFWNPKGDGGHGLLKPKVKLVLRMKSNGTITPHLPAEVLNVYSPWPHGAGSTPEGKARRYTILDFNTRTGGGSAPW
jgi:hypothetical protein